MNYEQQKELREKLLVRMFLMMVDGDSILLLEDVQQEMNGLELPEEVLTPNFFRQTDNRTISLTSKGKREARRILMDRLFPTIEVVRRRDRYA